MVNTRSSGRESPSASTASVVVPITKKSSRRAGNSDLKVHNLLELLKEHQPIGPMAWQTVTDLHNIRNQNSVRTTDSLKRKFKEPYQSKPNSGNPHIPQKVQISKEIMEAMAKRRQIGNFGRSSKLPFKSRILDSDDTETTLFARTDAKTDNGPLNSLPLSRKRTAVTENKESKVQDLLELYKLQMIQTEKNQEVQEKICLDERKEMQEKAEREINERREVSKPQRELEAQRHDAFMKMLAVVVTKNTK